jgi:hypothetical protein
LSLKVTKDEVAKVLAGIRGIEREQVLVGVPDARAERRVDPAEEDKGPINNAAIGYMMENGSPLANIPARPHLKPAIAEKRAELIAEYREGAKAILGGKATNATAVHHRVGLIAEAAVKAKITDGEFLPLAPRTIAARKRRGRKSEKPLIDTGQYRNSITHVVRPKR